MGILTRLGNRENSDDFCGELRMRIFNLMGNLNPWGLHAEESRMKIFYLQGIKKILTSPCWGAMKTLATSLGNKE